jgi:hypothetical protein
LEFSAFVHANFADLKDISEMTLKLSAGRKIGAHRHMALPRMSIQRCRRAG